jgi:hypothetical protein
MAWLDPAWLYRTAIRLDNRWSGAVAYTNQQVRPQFQAGHDLFARAKADGSDLRFTAADGTTLLNHFLGEYDDGDETIDVIVKVPSIAAGSITLVWCYYGNPAASSTSSYGNTCIKRSATADTICLFPFDQGAWGGGGSDRVTDATGNYTAIKTGTINWGAADGGGYRTNNATFATGSHIYQDASWGNYVSIAGLLDTMPDDMTLSLWWKKPSSVDDCAIFSKRNLAGNRGFVLELQGGTNLSIGSTDGTESTNVIIPNVVAASRWQHIALVRRNRRETWYLDGEILYNDPRPKAHPVITETFLLFGQRLGGTLFSGRGYADEFEVQNRASSPDEMRAMFARSAYAQGAYTNDRFVRQGIVLEADATELPSLLVHEPSVLHDGTTFRMWYTTSDAKTYMATSADGITWAKQGYSNEGFHTNVYFEGGTYYIYEPVSGLSGWRVSSSPDGMDWTLHDTVMTLPAWSSDDLGNTFLVKRGEGDYVFFYEGREIGNWWAVGYATGTSPLGPFTDQTPDEAIRSLSPWVYGVSIYGGEWVHRVRADGTYDMLLHGGELDGEVPTQMYRATARDPGGPWTIHGPLLEAVYPIEGLYDQEADPSLVEHDGTLFLYFTFIDNVTLEGGVHLATFAGTYDELIRNPVEPVVRPVRSLALSA